MPLTSVTVPGVGAVSVDGNGPYTVGQTGGVSGAYGLFGADHAVAEINVGTEQTPKVYAKTDAALAELNAIADAVNAEIED